MTIELGVALTCLALIVGALIWVFAQVSDVRQAVADHKVEVAEKYVSKLGFREAIDQFMREMAANFKHLNEKIDLLRGTGKGD